MRELSGFYVRLRGNFFRTKCDFEEYSPISEVISFRSSSNSRRILVELNTPSPSSSNLVSIIRHEKTLSTPVKNNVYYNIMMVIRKIVSFRIPLLISMLSSIHLHNQKDILHHVILLEV